MQYSELAEFLIRIEEKRVGWTILEKLDGRAIVVLLSENLDNLAVNQGFLNDIP